MVETTHTAARPGYKIGAVSRITGIGTETLRAWERRYQAVVPSRNSSGERIYSRDDVTKLLLLKSLVDSGSAISSVANLDIEELKEQWNTLSQASLDEVVAHGAHQGANGIKDRLTEKCRVGLIGDSFPLRIVDGLTDFQGIELIGVADTIQQWQSQYSDASPHVIIIEEPTVNEKVRNYAHRIIEQTKAWHVIVLYGFGTQEALNALQESQITAVRHSIEIYELARLCVERVGGSSRQLKPVTGATFYMEQSIPARRFSNKQLATIGRYSKIVSCECPQHISELIKNLVAFEIYSAECENKNAEDAVLHNYLHATTAQVRSIMEDALTHILKYENMTVE